MTNLYEVTERLAAIKQMIISDQKARPELAETPDNNHPAYWPNTIHGKSGMYRDDVAGKNRKESGGTDIELGTVFMTQLKSKSTPVSKDPIPPVA